MITDKNNDKSKEFITDSGIIKDSSNNVRFLFVLLCRILSVLLIILGIIAIINP
ncbi:MAG: hypothetical protein K6G06_04335 [Butyrivibrio sp.]|nr:hypothetical protein [Butyrivibrio sp.]